MNTQQDQPTYPITESQMTWLQKRAWMRGFIMGLLIAIFIATVITATLQIINQ